MVLRRSNITLRELLVRAKTLPLKDVPYGRSILFYLPTDFNIFPTDSAEELLKAFKDSGDESFLDQRLDEFLGLVESNLKRKIFRAASWIALSGSVVFMVLIGYLAFHRNEFPSWDLISLAMGAPAWLVLDRFGATGGEKLKKAGAFIKNFRKKKGSEGGYGERDYDDPVGRPYQPPESDDPYGNDDDPRFR